MLSADKAAGTLTVEDNGIGMGREELIDNLGTIARRAPAPSSKACRRTPTRATLIGQFGVGFYSAFMVAQRGRGHVAAGRQRRGLALALGRQGQLQRRGGRARRGAGARHAGGASTLLDDAKDYAEAGDHRTGGQGLFGACAGADRARSSATARRRRRWPTAAPCGASRKRRSSKEEYAEFYGHVSGQYDEPALTVHYRAEGRSEYSVLVFVPSMKPFDLFDPERKGRIKLYVRRVFITDEADILPAWLRFVRGVIDSEDLPLNLSREMLQTNPVLAAIGKAVTSRVLSELDKLADEDKETFEKVWEAFGAVLKEGLYEDAERRDALYKIARFKTTTGGEAWRSLADYVAGMRPNQTAIYYALGDDAAAIQASPQLEGFARHGIEVLLLSDPVDAFWVRTALGFDGKPFQSVTQGRGRSRPGSAGGRGERGRGGAGKRRGDACRALQADARRQGERGARVEAAGGERGLPGGAGNGTGPAARKDPARAPANSRHHAAPVLELNPTHGLVKALAGKASAGGEAAMLDDAAVILYGEAKILDGEPPDDPADHAARIARLIEKGLG